MKKNTKRKSFTELYAADPVKFKLKRATIRVPKPVIAELEKIVRARRRKDKRFSLSKLMVQTFTNFLDSRNEV